MDKRLARNTSLGQAERRALQDLSRQIARLPQGVVAVFPILSAPPHTTPISVGTTPTALTGGIRFTFKRGRRYVIRGLIRAITGASGSSSASVYDGSTDLVAGPFGGAIHENIAANYDQMMFELPFNGNGVTYNDLHIRGWAAATSDWYPQPANNTTPMFRIIDEGAV